MFLDLSFRSRAVPFLKTDGKYIHHRSKRIFRPRRKGYLNRRDRFSLKLRPVQRCASRYFINPILTRSCDLAP